MRILPLAAVAATLAVTAAAPAFAQSYDRPPVATTGSYADTAAYAPSSFWAGSQDGWVAHVDACRTRYRTYDPATDMYFSRPGVQSRCMLATNNYVDSNSGWSSSSALIGGVTTNGADVKINTGDVISRVKDTQN